MTQAYRALHHNGGMVVKYPCCFLDPRGSTTPKPTISFNSSSEMPVCRQNSVIVKVTVTLAIMLSPIFTWIKDDWASASCCHSAAVFSSGFGGITIFSTAYRSPVCFAHQTFAFNAQSLPGTAAGGIVNKMLSFSVGTVTLAPSAASTG